jgi:hypothetical protein
VEVNSTVPVEAGLQTAAGARGEERNTMTTIAIIGAVPGPGAAAAGKFGREGWAVGQVLPGKSNA